MKRIAVALAFGALALTAGCQVPNLLTDKPVLGATVMDERALIVTEAAFYGAQGAIEGAVDAGLLKGDNAAAVMNYHKAAYDALLLARAAYKAGDAATFPAKVAATQKLIAQAWALIPKKG